MQRWPKTQMLRKKTMKLAPPLVGTEWRETLSASVRSVILSMIVKDGDIGFLWRRKNQRHGSEMSSSCAKAAQPTTVLSDAKDHEKTAPLKQITTVFACLLQYLSTYKYLPYK